MFASELLDKIHQLRRQTDFSLDDVLSDISSKAGNINRKTMRDAAITLLAINEYFHNPRKPLCMPDITQTRTLDIVIRLSSCMQILVDDPSKLQKIVTVVGNRNPELVSEMAYGVFPALFGHFSIRSLRRSAITFLGRLKTCNEDNWGLVIPLSLRSRLARSSSTKFSGIR